MGLAAERGGLIVPRSHLRAKGVELAFREERFFDTHIRSLAALAAGAVDFVATHALPAADGTMTVREGCEGSRVVDTVGPIPGDVVVVARGVPAATARTVGTTLREVTLGPDNPLADLIGASGFGTVPPGHLESLARWIDEPLFGRSRPLPS